MRILNRSIKTMLLAATVSFAAGTASAQTAPVQKEVGTIDSSLTKLMQLQPRIYEYDQQAYKNAKLPAGKQYGFITANVENIFPDLVNTSSYRYTTGKNSSRTVEVKKVDLESLVPVLVASLQEQQQQILQLKAEIERLKEANGE